MSSLPLLLFCLALGTADWVALRRRRGLRTEILVVLAMSALGCGLFQIANAVINNGPGPYVLIAAMTQFAIGAVIGGVMIALRRIL